MKTIPVMEVEPGLELAQREIETLKFIHKYTGTNPLGQPPSYQEILDHLQKVLRRKDGRPELVSKQQVQTIIERLREKGLVVSADKNVLYRAPRHAVLTNYGRTLASRMSN